MAFKKPLGLDLVLILHDRSFPLEETFQMNGLPEFSESAMTGHKYLNLCVYKYETARVEACDVCFQKVECSSFLSDLFGVVLSLSIEFICFTLQIYVHFILHFFFCFF